MVSSTVIENGDDHPSEKITPVLGVPPGDYRLVGWDMDTTGKGLSDEICQVAVYTPGSQFSQYVMPYKNLDQTAKKRHQLHVVTTGRYRVLKNSSTNERLKTKSEMSALIDFLGWLETLKGDAADGVILVHHESRRVNPSLLIDALTRYNLLDKFKETVKGFANGFDIATAKCASSLKVFSLRHLSRIFFDKEEALESAVPRARLALQIVQHLSVGEENGQVSESIGNGDSDAAIKKTVEFIREFVRPVESQEKEYAELKVVLVRQKSLAPIFRHHLDRRRRQHATPLRRLLAESGIDSTQLQEAWANGQREGLLKLVKEKVTAESTCIDDLIEVLECHFDPEKQPPKLSNEEKKKLKEEKPKKKNGEVQSETESPDTTTCHSPIKVKEVVEESVVKSEGTPAESN